MYMYMYMYNGPEIISKFHHVAQAMATPFLFLTTGNYWTISVNKRCLLCLPGECPESLRADWLPPSSWNTAHQQTAQPQRRPVWWYAGYRLNFSASWSLKFSSVCVCVCGGGGGGLWVWVCGVCVRECVCVGECVWRGSEGKKEEGRKIFPYYQLSFSKLLCYNA